MICKCSVCNGRDFNPEGIKIASEEIIPFVSELINFKYKNHPFPMRYKGLMASCYAYSQALAYDRVHGIISNKYFTSNRTFLKHSKEFVNKFGIEPRPISEMTNEVRYVCEFNTGK